MDATPVEKLTGVDSMKLPTGPPSYDSKDDTFSSTHRERIRLLGGVS
jgi:hypothetical protein